MGEAAMMPAAICAAMVKAQKAAESVPKDRTAKTPNFSYAYASSEAVMAECRDALASAGLAVIPQGWRLARGDEHTADRVVVRYLLIHEGGECWLSDEVSTPSIPGKGRPEDKAEAAALTFNLGYYLRGLLLLPRVAEAEEVNARNDEGHQPSARAPQRIPFGKGKGKTFGEATEDELQSYRGACARGLDDAKWGARNKTAVEAIDAELAKRGGGEDKLASALSTAAGEDRKDRDVIAELDRVRTDEDLGRWCRDWRDVLSRLDKPEKSAVWAGVQRACSSSGVSEEQAKQWLSTEKEAA